MLVAPLSPPVPATLKMSMANNIGLRGETRSAAAAASTPVLNDNDWRFVDEAVAQSRDYGLISDVVIHSSEWGTL